MRHTRAIKSETFRHAALFAALFLILTGVLIVVVLWIVQSTQESALNRANDADIATVINGFRDEGIDEAVEVIRQRLGSPKLSRIAPQDCYILLQDAGGAKIAGNVTSLPRRVGQFTTTLDAAAPSANGNADVIRRISVTGRGIEIADRAYLFVGRSIQPVAETREEILQAFVWIALGAALIATAAGVFLGTRFTRRVDSIADTCSAIIAGRLDERIAVTGRGDEWDRLSVAINDMLDRIAALLDNLRQVSSDVAHDLRTPLTRLRNRLETARACPDSSVITQAIDDADQLLSMFSALLRISQIESGTRASNFASVNLSEVAEKVFQIYLPVAEDHLRPLDSRIADQVIVHGDGELLTQMLSNLIENSLRHTPPGTAIKLQVSVEHDLPCVSVIDDGEGIPEKERGKVLRRFYRVSTSRQSTGHGLGLALVAAIAELHHASLSLTDARPGLRIRVAFPAAAPRAET